MGKHYKQLSIEERTLIQTGLSQGYKASEIARELCRSTSTVSRELQRNGWSRPQEPRRAGRPSPAGGYKSDEAQRRAQRCAIEPRTPCKLRSGNALWGQVKKYLCVGYSPEQIAATLAAVHPDTPSFQVSHETIYTAIYAMPRGELRTEVISWLRQATPACPR